MAQLLRTQSGHSANLQGEARNVDHSTDGADVGVTSS